MLRHVSSMEKHPHSIQLIMIFIVDCAISLQCYAFRATGGEINHQLNKTLDNKNLREVITKLERSDFPVGRWADLRLRLHITQPKLDTVKDDNPQNAKECLQCCLILWLQQDYDVDEYGKPTLEKLVTTAVKEMGLRAVADKIGKIDMISEPE
uniref:Death domain-containing protein n=1 Tax=Amphimedon queenslandica TaxID=400682 RepID=A0A1X7SP90_AMPQE